MSGGPRQHTKNAILIVFLAGCGPGEVVEAPLPSAEELESAPANPGTAAEEPAPIPEMALDDVQTAPELVLPGEVGFDHDGLLAELQNATSREFKPVGHTSIAFRMRLDSEHTAAFRPRTRRHRRGHLAEVAAYALGRFLGLDNVVPATLRSETRRRMSEHLHPRYDDAGTWDELDERIFYRSPFETPGAAIYWVPGLIDTELDQAPARAEWEGWLAGHEIPEDSQALARDLSNVRVFDYLIANWDRFSGGNLKLFAGTPGRVALRDHNVAFGRLGARREASLRNDVRDTHRFSRAVIARLHQLDAEGLQAAIALFNSEEERAKLGIDVLHPNQLEAVLERAAIVLSHVGALIESEGVDAVLYFE